MSDDPYRPPNSNFDVPPPKRNSLPWIVLFWITATSTVLSAIALTTIPGITFLDLLSMIVTIGMMVGFYGFAYYKPIINIVFWRYFFYVALLDFAVMNIALPLLGIETYGQISKLDGYYLFGLAYTIVILYGLNHYAYKRAFIWQSQNT